MKDDIVVRRAQLIELKDDLTDLRPGAVPVPVQFNPESLKLSYANQVQNQNNGSSSAAAPAAANQSQGSAARQYVGAGTTKLSVQLWFDVSAATDQPFKVDDVRRLTAKVLYFMKPRAPQGGSNNASQRVPPGVRFAWGSFLFDGVVEALEETVEFFSPDGHALRASVALTLAQQDILVPAFSGDGRVNRVPGTQPMGQAQGGQPLQQMSGAATGGGGAGPGAAAAASPGSSRAMPGGAVGGLGAGGLSALASGAGLGGASWQQVALANGIENPRDIPAGQFIDFGATRARIVTE